MTPNGGSGSGPGGLVVVAGTTGRLFMVCGRGTTTLGSGNVKPAKAVGSSGTIVEPSVRWWTLGWGPVGAPT